MIKLQDHVNMYLKDLCLSLCGKLVLQRKKPNLQIRLTTGHTWGNVHCTLVHSVQSAMQMCPLHCCEW